MITRSPLLFELLKLGAEKNALSYRSRKISDIAAIIIAIPLNINPARKRDFEFVFLSSSEFIVIALLSDI